MVRLARFALPLTAVLFLGAVTLPDLRQGVINGRKALILWPSHDKVPLEPDRCVAHFIQPDDSELLFPCGVWIQPPANRYKVWIEQRDLISPSRDYLVWSGGPFNGRGMGSIMDVVIGGHVQLDPSIEMPVNHRLELVHLDSHRHPRFMRRLFIRYVPASKRRDRVLMPAGGVFAAITDPKGNAIALSRPVMVPERGPVPILPQRPKSGADVFVAMVRARAYTSKTPDEVTLALRTETSSRAPDVVITGGDRIYAAWYAVDAPRAIFEVASKTVALPAEELTLRPGTVVTLRRTLQLLPSS